ncbi:MAG: phenylalanine--tRNA ligase subunit alpha [Limnobacter sp.]|nr:phenylalanine--tRNA ligase subunit alpha [Limnobacter sp.]
MDSSFQAILDSAEKAFSNAPDFAALENAKAAFLGKTGQVTDLLKGMAQLSPEDKKTQGQAVNLLKSAVEEALNLRREALADAAMQAKLSVQAIDISKAGRKRGGGGLHPAMRTLERIETIFHSAGFDLADGPEIETDFYNFTALNTPENHPARSMHDTFYVEGGHLLRTHTSPMQVRYMQTHASPIRVIAPGRVYRVDSDATHSPMFHQVEGLWIDEGISFADLKAVFIDFLKQFFETDDLIIRFRPSFFPFTEPSAEIDMAFTTGPNKGKWLEIAGSGQVHPNVLRHVGLDPEKYTGFAFGVGPDRLTMLRYGIHDLRLFYENDMRFLQQFS